MAEPWIERVIREAQEQGKFDDVAGTGQPIADLERPYDPAWWARRWVTRERHRQASLDLVRKLDAALPRVLATTVEHKVQAGLESLNTEIERHNVDVPEENRLPLLDVERLLQQWASRRRA